MIAATRNRPLKIGQAEDDPLPAPVAPAAHREHDQHHAEHRRDPGAEMEEGEADPDRDELGDQGDEVGEDEIAGREPAPQRPEALEHELAVATMGDRADPHAHLLADDRHRELRTMNGRKNPSPYVAPLVA